MKLRYYQQEAHDKILEAWNEHDILMYVLATGGGKTVTFVEIMKDMLLIAKRVTLVAHRQELIYQAHATLRAQGIESGIIMGATPQRPDLPAQVCSIQTISRRKDLKYADIYIFDEGHHAQPDNTYGKIISTAATNGSKILLVTATPYRLSGEGFEYLHSYKKTHLIIGKSLKELTDEGWLVQLRYFVASIPDLTKIRLQAGDYREDDSEAAMQLAPIVDSYLEHVNGKQGICFCVNVSHSIRTVQQYLMNGIAAAHIDANTPNDERRQIIHDYKEGKYRVICNVGIITEGADFPNCEFVQLATPTKSLSKYLQMIGRVTRACIDIDKYNSPEQRKHYIRESKKPFGYILDNAGCWMDHNLPEMDHDWEFHFRGARKVKKEDEMMEMLVFVAENELGMRVRTTNPTEILGMRLIEIKKETKQAYIDMACLKEFDKTYFSFQKIKHMKKPGYLAIEDFIKYCQKRNILMVDKVWDHLYSRCVTEIEEKLNALQINRARNMSVIPDEIYAQQITHIKRGLVSREWLSELKEKYRKRYSTQLSVAKP